MARLAGRYVWRILPSVPFVSRFQLGMLRSQPCSQQGPSRSLQAIATTLRSWEQLHTYLSLSMANSIAQNGNLGQHHRAQ